MTDTTTVPDTDGQPATISQASLDQMQADLDASLAGIVAIIANSTGLPAGITVRLDPAEVMGRILADGTLDASNEFVLTYGDTEGRFGIGDVVGTGGDINAVITATLVKMGAMLPLSDRQLINALLSRLGGSVELTLEEVAAAQLA